MKTKHTQKWSISKDRNGLYIDSDSGMICEINPKQPLQQANAKIISVAPEMLEELNRIVNFMYSNKSILVISNLIDDLNLKQTKKIIKKATE